MTENFSEIRFGEPGYSTKLGQALTQIGFTRHNRELKAATLRQVGTMGLNRTNLQNAEEHRFNLIGKLALLLEAGALLEDRLIERFKNDTQSLSEASSHIQPVEVRDRVRPTPRNPARETADAVIDAVATGTSAEDIGELLDEAALGLQEYGTVHSLVERELNDFEGQDPDTREMLESMGERARELKGNFREALSIVKMFQENKKAERKASRKRVGYDAKKAVKTAKNTKHRKVDTHYKIVSIPADEIVGAKALLVFNIKTRRIGLYRAPEGQTLSIKGTTIQNFDPETSISRILRNTERDLPAFRQANRFRRAEVLFENLKGVTHKMKGRINGDTVLLRAYKD